jgi:hypothetical protein
MIAPMLDNLATMLRLWALRRAAPAAPAAMAGSTRLFMGLGVAWLLLWVGIDWWYAQPDAQFVIDGVPLLAWYALAVLGLAALLRSASRPKPAFRAALALALGLVPVPLLLAAGAASVSRYWLIGLCLAAGTYSVLYFARGLRAFTGESQRPAALAALVFILGFIWLSDALDVIPDVWVQRETAAQASDSGGADAEGLLFEQAALIDKGLAAMDVDPAGRPKSFFLGFAGVGDEKVFAQEIGLAARVLAHTYGTDHRALSLINDERDLDGAPLASVSGLRYALRGIGARMNPQRDVLFLSISSHGTQDPAIAVSNSQLPLDDLTDGALAEALSDSGIKWRVIIISACYAGAFIDSLKDRQTIVIAASAADRTSFGCSNDRDLTYFGEAFYRDALPGARSLREAFDTARNAIAARERREHIDASKPQAFFGVDLEAKLASMSLPTLIP